MFLNGYFELVEEQVKYKNNLRLSSIIPCFCFRCLMKLVELLFELEYLLVQAALSRLDTIQ
jgi:hypothetical protein